MGLNEILLVIAALLPAVILCVYVYKKDRADKEPIGILLLLLFLGVVICIPAVIMELILSDIINGIFSAFSLLSKDGFPINEFARTLYQFSMNTFGVALVEEGLKWIVLFTVARKSRHFNSLFDGIIYAVFVSLGFAAFENVLYVLENGWINAIMRAVLSVPGHMFFAVIMGCYFSSYFTKKLAHQTELDCKRRGIISGNHPEFSEGKDLALSIIMPTLCHGFYNFCLSMESAFYLLLVLALVICLYILCFSRIKSTSNQDTHVLLCVLKLMDAKYPGYSEMAAKTGTIPQFDGIEGPTAGILPSFPLDPGSAPANAAPALTPGYLFAGVYTNTAGIVHIAVPVKQPITAGSTIMTIQAPSGQVLPIVANLNCHVDKYNVREGDTVAVNQLLGVIKYAL